MSKSTEESQDIEPLFDIEDRGFRVRAFYLPESLGSDAHVTITRNGELFRMDQVIGYKVFNISAHFHDMVDDWLWKEGNM